MAVAAAKKTLSLRDAKTEKEVCLLQRDHFDVGDFGVMSNGTTVWLTEQRLGEKQKQVIEVPKKVFDKLIDVYMKPQKTGR